MTLPAAKIGERLKVNKKVVPYSYWPTRTSDRGIASLQFLLFSHDPWGIIHQTIKVECPAASMSEALACLQQARDFYGGAIDVTQVSARPLSMYYCFMNLVKAFCLTRGTQTTFDKAQHGLSEKLQASNRELQDAYLSAFPSPSAAGQLQNFSEFKNALTGSQIAAQQDFDLPLLLPQILPGHRLWSQAANKKERFIAIHSIQSLVNRATSEIWLRVYFVAEDLARIGVTHATLLLESGLNADFQQVATGETDSDGRSLLCLEQRVPHACPTSKCGNYLQALFDFLKPHLWATVASIPPYRRHYVYLKPTAEAASTLPQLLSIYAIAYYLGSITRYRPHHFPAITDGKFGPRISDFITGQPQQFLYLIASEFSKRELARPSII
jgi:hypothetical protein